ncbi:MAG: acetyl-CoA carboxylase biotin carboxyl carrier protein [Thermoleophilia bacterium]
MLASDRVTLAAGDVYGPAVSLPPDLEAAIVSRLGRLGMSRSLLEVSDEARQVSADLGGLTFAYPLGDALVGQACDHVIDGERYGTLDPILAEAVQGRFGAPRGPVLPQVQEAAVSAEVSPAGPEPSMAQLAQEGRGWAEEDLVLLAQFPDAAERLAARRASLRTEVAEEGGPAIDRAMLETLIQAVEGSTDSEGSGEMAGARVTVRRSTPAAGAAAAGPGGSTVAGPADDHMHRVLSPMVGTFYRASSPEADPFVREGQKVEAGEVLCLIEAMKLFNEITADVAGTVRTIAVENGHGVEFGEVLFVIEPVAK